MPTLGCKKGSVQPQYTLRDSPIRTNVLIQPNADLAQVSISPWHFLCFVYVVAAYELLQPGE